MVGPRSGSWTKGTWMTGSSGGGLVGYGRLFRGEGPSQRSMADGVTDKQGLIVMPSCLSTNFLPLL